MIDTDQIHNRIELKVFRKNLRNNSTSAEATLWLQLKNSQLDGRKFRRQHSVGAYILDFYCPAEKLCIELDGADHYTSNGEAYDEERTKYLNSLNIRVIRFENNEVFQAIEYVLGRIRSCFNHP
jgi:very-short-patch-repair endonuclease